MGKIWKPVGTHRPWTEVVQKTEKQLVVDPVGGNQTTPKELFIDLMLSLEDEAELHEWLTNAVVVAPFQDLSRSQVVIALETEGLSVIHCSQIGEKKFLASLAGDLEVRKSLKVVSAQFKVLGQWHPDIFCHSRFAWIRCFGFPLEGWTEKIIKTFGQKFGNLIEIHSRNLNKEDCSLLHLLLEVGIHDRVPQSVLVNINGKSYPDMLMEVVSPMN